MINRFKILLFYTLLLLSIFIEAYVLSWNYNYITLSSDMNNKKFINAVTDSSLKYFSTFIIKTNNSDFSLTFVKNQHCSSIPYKLHHKNIYLCATHNLYNSAQFNQLKATVDSPIMRQWCRTDSDCNLPKALNMYEKPIKISQ